MAVRNRTFLLMDVSGWALAPLIALVIRLDGVSGIEAYADRAALFALIAVGLQFLGLYIAGMYRRVWQYAGSHELFAIAAALSVAGLAAHALYVVLTSTFVTFDPDGRQLPRSVPILNAFLAIAWSGGCRFAAQYVASRNSRGRRRGERALIIGAGSAGSILAWQIRSDGVNNVDPVGFIDDDSKLHGQVIHGVAVLGGRKSLVRAARTYRAGTAIIAMPSVDGSVIRELRELCHAADLRVLTVPRAANQFGSEATLTKLRALRIEDLLRRHTVHTDDTESGKLLAGKTVLVTGAGGSIGSELCRQIAQLDVAEIVLLGHGENSIFAIENELRGRHPALRITAVIADVRDSVRVDALFARFRPHTVFHAAAHKHVPLMEMNPEEAVTNNVGARTRSSAPPNTGARRTLS